MLGFMHRGVFILGRMRLWTFMLIKGYSSSTYWELNLYCHAAVSSIYHQQTWRYTHTHHLRICLSRFVNLKNFTRLLKVLAKLTPKRKDLGRCRYRHVYRENQLIVWISTVATVWAKLRPGHCGWFPCGRSRHLPPTRAATSGVWKNTRSIQVPNPRYLQIITPQIHIYSTGMYRVIPETIGWFHPAEGRSGFPLVPHHPGCRGRSPEGLQWENITIRPKCGWASDWNWRLLLATSNQTAKRFGRCFNPTLRYP